MVEHHTHYKDIHGFDKTIWMTVSEHKKLHIRLRKENQCNVPSDKLRKISNAANNRTTKHKQFCKKYESHRNGFVFNETMDTNVYLNESIRYNNLTGCVGYLSRFMAASGKKLLVVDLN